MSNEPTREEIEVRLLEPWGRNPRGAELRGMPEFIEQLREEGIREDLHAFRDAHGVMRIMQGHRRRAAAVALKMERVWVKVWPFSENEAFLHLLTMQNGADPFDARELAMASREAMAMGIDKEALIGAMHRRAETVQLYLDLGTLPHRVQEAVYAGKLALGTAGLMRQLSKEQMELAMEDILTHPITHEPMSETQARVHLENRFLKPERWRKEWAVLAAKLKRKLVAGGLDAGMVDVVAWEDREQFVMSDAVPQSLYALCEEHIDDALLVKPGEPMTWGDLARGLGVPWHLAPAMVREAKHVLMVRVSAVRDADSTRGDGERVLRARGEKAKVRGERREEMEEADDASEEQRAEGGEAEADDELGEREMQREEEVPVFDLERWRRIHARLMRRPEMAMQNGLWEALMKTQWEALHEIVPAEAYVAMMGEMGRDEVGRKGLRWCLLAIVALAMLAEDEEALEELEPVEQVKPE